MDFDFSKFCPACGSQLIQQGGCLICPHCGWSECNEEEGSYEHEIQTD